MLQRKFFSNRFEGVEGCFFGGFRVWGPFLGLGFQRCGSPFYFKGPYNRDTLCYM